MKFLAAIAFVLALVGEVHGQIATEDVISAQGYSRQFVAYTPRFFFPSKYSGTNSITLQPALLVMSCERIKQSLYRMLGVTTRWQSRIFLHLRTAQSPKEQTTIVAQQMPRDWAYHLELPDSLDRSRFLRTIVQALLLEIANRSGGSHSAEIPAWLAEGLSQELLANDGLEILLPPPSEKENGIKITRINLEARRMNSLTLAKQELQTHSPLSFEQLGWPDGWQLSGEPAEVYRCSSQLFVNQLLLLPNGPACLRAMLADLPRRYNWQFAFLSGFQSQFHNELDVEKWWALKVVGFTGRELTQTWSLEESAKKLDEIIRPDINVRSKPEQMPQITETSLQTAIRELNGPEQVQVIQARLNALDLMRPRISPQLIALVDDYRQVLGDYLQLRKMSGPFVVYKRRADAIAYKASEQVVKQLDELDVRRTAMHPAPPEPVAEASAIPVR